MNTVVVTGALGSVGSRVVTALLERDDVHKVVAIDSVRSTERHPKLATVVADLAEPGALDLAEAGALDLAEAGALDLAEAGALDGPAIVGALRGATSVIHLAWVTADSKGLTSDDRVRIARANSRSTSAVLDMVALSEVRSIVHVSSATVYGAWADNDVPLSEESRILPNPELAFAVAKAEAERIIAEWSDTHSSVTVAVLRPAVTVGSGDRPLYQALQATRTPRVAREGRLVQYLHVDDLASAVVFAWERRLDGVFNVAPDSGISEEEARRLAGGIAKVGMPGRLAGALAALGWKFWRRGVPSEALAYATYPWVVSPDRLVDAGWHPAYSSAEALVATDARWHWDDLPPGKRQNLNSLLALSAAVTVVGAVSALVLSRRRRTKRSALQP